MSQLIHYTLCPVCGSASIEEVMSAEDFTVSHETFAIWECTVCTLRFTQNIPQPESIGRYYQSDAYVSHSDTQKGLVNRLYHLVRNHTIQGKIKMIQRATGKEKGRLLDVGAGTGVFAQSMQAAGWEVTGLEPDPTARKKAMEKSGMNLRPSEDLYVLEEASFDAITLWHVLEHVHDLQGYLKQFLRLLSLDGKLIIAVPNYTSKDATIYQEYWAAYDVPRHLYHFSPQSMELLAVKIGFRLEKWQPMWFDSFYVSLLSGQYRKDGMNLLRAGCNGLLSNLVALFNKKRGSSLIYQLAKN